MFSKWLERNTGLNVNDVWCLFTLEDFEREIADMYDAWLVKMKPNNSQQNEALTEINQYIDFRPI